MRGIKRFGLSLMLMSVTACAPVVYDATYRAPRGHVAVQPQPSYHYETTYQQFNPIEVMLYADNSYTGVYLRPVQIIISDGQFVQIPVKNRRGRTDQIFAHYHRGDLHFDSNRSCQVIQGSTRYSYDKRWDKGYKYTKINAGRDYDLSGLRLQIRNVPTGRHQSKEVSPAKVVNKQIAVQTNNRKRVIKQTVAKELPRNVDKKIAREQRDPVNSWGAKVSDYNAKDNQGRSTKVLRTKNKAPAKTIVKTYKTTNRQVIVERINKHEQAMHVANVPQKVSEKKTVKVRKTTQKQANHVGQTRKHTVKKVTEDSRSIQESVERDDAVQEKSLKEAKFAKKSLTHKEGESRNVALVAENSDRVNGANSKKFKSDATWSKGKTRSDSTY